MKMTIHSLVSTFCIVASAFTVWQNTAIAEPLPSWPDIFEPTRVADLNVKVKADDWLTILQDDTFDIEVPALFWAAGDGDESVAILVSIRRKSATPINGKVSFKIDINEYEDLDPRAVSKWKGIKKLSLENGDDQDVVSEGLTWQLHKLALAHGIYPVGHTAGMASWVTLTTHLAPACGELCDPFTFGATQSVEPQGVYLHVEQPDKQFLKNRDLWTSGETWFYKQDDIGAAEVKEAGCDPEDSVSPTVAALQCSPFIGPSGKGRNKIDPRDCTSTELGIHIDMDTMLGVGAVNNFSVNPDELFTKEKNFYWADFSDYSCLQVGEQRVYFPWDLDAAIGGQIDSNIYGKTGKQTDTQRVILGDNSIGGFRDRYNGKLAVLAGSAFIADAKALLNTLEPVLSPHLAADPNSKVGSDPAGHFESLRQWLDARTQSVSEQLCADAPLLCF